MLRRLYYWHIGIALQTLQYQHNFNDYWIKLRSAANCTLQVLKAQGQITILFEILLYHVNVQNNL